MNREIKFRAWNEGKTMFPNSKRLLMVKRDFGEVWNKGDSIIWMQFTGLKDKNGKEIYEGDIVKGIALGSFGERIVEVEFKDGGFYPFTQGCGKDLYLIHFENSEVIGNIYENPELLK